MPGSCGGRGTSTLGGQVRHRGRGPKRRDAGTWWTILGSVADPATDPALAAWSIFGDKPKPGTVAGFRRQPQHGSGSSAAVGRVRTVAIGTLPHLVRGAASRPPPPDTTARHHLWPRSRIPAMTPTGTVVIARRRPQHGGGSTATTARAHDVTVGTPSHPTASYGITGAAPSAETPVRGALSLVP